MTAGWLLPKVSKILPLLRDRCQKKKHDCASADLCVLKFQSKSKNEAGQATVEYVLLLSVIGAMALGFTIGFNRLIQDGLTRFNTVLERDLSPGSWNVRGGVDKRHQWKIDE